MESQPSLASISRQPGRGSSASAPMLENDILPPSYEMVTASPLSVSTENTLDSSRDPNDDVHPPAYDSVAKR